MKKKLLAALLAGVMAVGLTACGGNTSTDAPAADGEANGELSLIHISEPTRPLRISRMPSSA